MRIHLSKSIIFFLLLLSVSLSSCKKKNDKKILVFSKTLGDRHSSIEPAKLALIDLGNKNGFSVDTTEDASSFSGNNLKKYSAVVFLNTSGDVLDFHQEAAFERYIQAGGGFVGIHAAADTEYDWPWYGKLVGGYFNGHSEIRKAPIHVKDHDHASTKGLPDEWRRTDEWYNFKNISNHLHVLLSLDDRTYTGETNGSKHPISWYQEYDGGRVFYCGGGHTEEGYKDSLFLSHILGGIEYAIGDNERDYSRSKTAEVPEQNRFSKTIVSTALDEPMELAVAPDGKVFFIERGGRILLFDPKTEVTRQIHHLNVFDDLEDGLLGITIDPDYSSNKRIFVFYSPAGEIAVQHVSTFTFDEHFLELKSERIVIKIPTQRQECCHSAGSLAFDANGNLFIAVGDNTNSHASSGYSAQDERPGRAPFDAQGTSANTHDLRGKILRIHPEEDGTYTIPEGNLFPKDGSKGRPEIYAMGCRNPYRITVNTKNNYVYWGDVGPDAGEDGLQGPQGYDEINEARKPGNFGWPYFIGDNKAYPRFNFATGEIGEKNNPEKPTNFSVNNTGVNVLPPAQKPIIWYSYSASKAFPSLGKSGRTAMAGPFYFFSDYKNNIDKFPRYYDSTMIVYDWMRDLAVAARFDKKGHLQSLEPIFSALKLHHPIDMEFSPDGTLYVLEYGQNWFAANPEASLSRIDFNRSNRPPVAEVEISDSAGTL
ncbi:MAG TPA: ThuA domain-containing protein, partial [Cytophagaceae bacterium]